MRRTSIPTLPVLAAGFAAMVLSPSAMAQMLNGPMMPDTPQGPRPQSAAPALPGLAGRAAPAPIPAEPGQNLGPQEALFDAIDRGDLAAARDAMARGADLNARNVLGLTPLESSVDQGRKEITFFLLSSRPMVVGAPPPAAAPRQGSAAARNMPLSAPSSQITTGRVAPAPRPSAPALSSSTRTDGGTPRPEQGFLGFDAGRPSGG
ncbi:hypothetical protein ACFOD4_01065 [Pseudoroseomonas globiformis]|uniref:Ankyrin repeat domain-containing protein n=1 Tax=Teichococcus globiformis TaxID=2307229 RepID=A0ABV7FWT9_9PROT